MKMPTLTQPEREVVVGRYVLGAGISATAVMLLTSFHHVYGAVVYDTPWRHHVAFVALAAIVFVGTVLYVSSKRPASTLGHVALWLAIAAIALVPVGMIGLFEGTYNHLLKNILYFGGAPDALMRQPFPPPTYEMPDDFLFELSGVLQVLPAYVAARYTYGLVGIGIERIKQAKGIKTLT